MTNKTSVATTAYLYCHDWWFTAAVLGSNFVQFMCHSHGAFIKFEANVAFLLQVKMNFSAQTAIFSLDF